MKFPTPNQAARNCWLILLAIVTIFILAGNRKTVTGSYRFASQAWLEGEPLYNSSGDGFLYLPAAAIVYMPFHLLPLVLGDILWRVLTIGCYAAGVYRLTRIAGATNENRLYLVTTLCTIPLAWSSARNGQSTLLVAGLMMLAAAELARERWSRAGLWLSIGLAVKPMVIVMSLLVGALHRPMRWRLAAGTLVVLAFPLILQNPSYAWDQTTAIASSLARTVERGHETYFAQFFGMLLVGGVDVEPLLQHSVRLVAALGTLALCLHLQRRYDQSRTEVYVFALSALYLMLFNPRTENNTYSLLAPAIALCAAEAWQLHRRRELAFVVTCLLCTVGSFEFGRLITARQQSVWLAPLAACFFAVYLVRRIMRERQPLQKAMTQELNQVAETTKRRAA